MFRGKNNESLFKIYYSEDGDNIFLRNVGTACHDAENYNISKWRIFERQKKEKVVLK
jgi:hypothetical protein